MGHHAGSHHNGSTTRSALGPLALGAGLAVLAGFGRKFAMQAPTAIAGNWMDGLIAEHKMVRGLIDKLKETDASDTHSRKTLIAKIKMALTKHALEEENVVYQALWENGEEEAARQLIDEHADVKHFLYMFEKMQPDSPDFLLKVNEFESLLIEHMNKEERELFPALRNQLTDDQNKKLSLRMNKEGLAYA